MNRESGKSRLSAAVLVLVSLCLRPVAHGDGERPPRYAFCDQWLEKTASLGDDITGFFPGDDNWLFTYTDFSPPATPTDRDVAALKKFVELLAARGTKLVLVVPPTRGVMEERHSGPFRRKYVDQDTGVAKQSHRAAITALERSGAIVPDLQAAVDNAKLPPSFDFYRKQDTHWLGVGARLSAFAVAAEVNKRLDLSKLPKTPHVTRTTTTGPYRSPVMDKMAEVCGPKIKVREQDVTFVTEAQGEAASGGDLLGGTAAPIVLAGTSFSRPDSAYNFGGFLAEAFGMDVLNVAIPGGKLATSILSYLGSEDFTSAPPAVLIWEVRPFELPTGDFLGQVLATMAGSCPVEQALLKQDTPLQRGLTQVMAFTPEQRGKLKSPVFLDIAVGETGVNKYLLRMNYTDLTKEDVVVDLTRAVFPPGHFFHTLTPAQLSKLESISLRPAARLNGKVSVSLCPAKRAS